MIIRMRTLECDFWVFNTYYTGLYVESLKDTCYSSQAKWVHDSTFEHPSTGTSERARPLVKNEEESNNNNNNCLLFFFCVGVIMWSNLASSPLYLLFPNVEKKACNRRNRLSLSLRLSTGRVQKGRGFSRRKRVGVGSGGTDTCQSHSCEFGRKTWNGVRRVFSSWGWSKFNEGLVLFPLFRSRKWPGGESPPTRHLSLFISHFPPTVPERERESLRFLFLWPHAPMASLLIFKSFSSVLLLRLSSFIICIVLGLLWLLSGWKWFLFWYFLLCRCFRVREIREAPSFFFLLKGVKRRERETWVLPPLFLVNIFFVYKVFWTRILAGSAVSSTIWAGIVLCLRKRSSVFCCIVFGVMYVWGVCFFPRVVFRILSLLF